MTGTRNERWLSGPPAPWLTEEEKSNLSAEVSRACGDPGRIETRRVGTLTGEVGSALLRWARSEVGLRRQDMLLLAALIAALHYLD